MQATTDLDRAIVAYRENPTEANRQRVLALQAQHAQAFLRREAESFIERMK